MRVALLLSTLVLLSASPAVCCGGERYAVDEFDPSRSTMAAVIHRYTQDERMMQRGDRTPLSEPAREATQAFYTSWRDRLKGVDFESLDQAGKVDYVLLEKQIEYELSQMEHEAELEGRVAAAIPFAETIVQLERARLDMKPVDPQQAAAQLDELAGDIETASRQVREGEITLSREDARQAEQTLRRMSRTLRSWNEFYTGYDPMFTWWVKQPYANVSEQLDDYSELVSRELVGGTEDDLIGSPIGRKALLESLRHELIAYSPEELIRIGEKELAWCREEYRKAAEELGVDDWRAAMNVAKDAYVPPGEQPELIRRLAWEAINYLEEHDLVSIPPLARDGWRMNMMSVRRQRVNPYFTGGETISVSYPTDEMSHRDKLMSMRGNNPHFARATVHHELIPGHHLQGFMAQRYNTHRSAFRTPFLVEGWALYWEMLLYDRGDFAKTAKDRVGFLFWRSHRCARIIFSLRYHLGEMSAEEAVDFLVENIGHERRNATAEVRRSIIGGYDPLYQAAYMLGGLQLMDLRRQLVDSGEMGEKEFHDAVLMENSIPVDMIRASLTGAELEPGYEPGWRFYNLDDVAARP